MSTDVDLQDSSLDEALAAEMEKLEEPAVEVESTESPEPAETLEEAIYEALEPAPKWDKRYKEVFSGWGETDENGNPLYPNGRDWQQAVLDLYNEGQSYTTKVEQERAQLRQAAEQYGRYAQEWDHALADYRDMIAESGATPQQFARQMSGLAMALRNDPQSTILRLAREANIDLREALEGQGYVSPESKQIQDLQRQLGMMRQETLQREQRQVADRMQHIAQQNEAEIQAFAEATDDQGNLLHPHLEQVQETMAELILGRENLRRNNPNVAPLGLDEAYQRAIRLNSDIFEAEQKAAEAAKLKAANAAAKKASDAAKRVKGGTSTQSTPKKSIDDMLDEAISQTN